MTNRETTYEADGYDVLFTVVFDNLTGATSLTGASVAIDAVNISTGVKTSGVASVASATTIRATLTGWSLPAGTYSVQIRARPPGYSEQTPGECSLTVLPSAAPHP